MLAAQAHHLGGGGFHRGPLGDRRYRGYLAGYQLSGYRLTYLRAEAPSGKAMLGMLGVFAKFERSMIQERVRAGLARAQAKGK